ncbi:MAG: hypothetical protein ACFB5Z_16840 [Elainellaceae cyanobacterium]
MSHSTHGLAANDHTAHNCAVAAVFQRDESTLASLNTWIKAIPDAPESWAQSIDRLPYHPKHQAELLDLHAAVDALLHQLNATCQISCDLMRQ